MRKKILTKRTTILGALLLLFAVVFGVRIFLASVPPLINGPILQASNAEDLAAQGEYLARAGDCVACHSVPGGKAFAGGLKMGSPLGAIYSTNITPDRETGIGNDSLADFDRALRHGIGKKGQRLYPAMPYPSYAKLSDNDVRALYAFFMIDVQPVHQANMPNDIPQLLSFRWPLAIWTFLFTESGSYTERTDHDTAWNRGAYLVQSLGHCGACHTPRGLAFQEKGLTERSASYLAGSTLDGWAIPNLRGDLRTGLGSWSVSDIVAFLKNGHNRNVSAYGSMTDVINNSTPYLSDIDLNAIAVYLKSLPESSREEPYVYDASTTEMLQNEHPLQGGALFYTTTCSSCHGSNGQGFSPDLPPLAGNATVLEKDPASLVNILISA